MSEGSIVKGAASVTTGTVFVQLGGSLGQFVYAFWLTPEDFGVWATASASVALLGAFMNAGEANGYLAGGSFGLRGVLRNALRINAVLALIALGLSAVYCAAGNVKVAFLVLMLAVSLPLQGRASMFVAAFIKTRLHTELVLAQVLATLLRLSVGIAAAAIWHSPIALALALLANSSAMVVLTHLQARRRAPEILEVASEPASPWRLRIDRAIHQFSQTLPTQIDYLVVSLVATPQLLGLYFLAYQASAAISGLVAAPLSKTAMAELSRIPSDERFLVVGRLLLGILGVAGLLAAIGGFLALGAREVLPGRWVDVVAPFAILLASVPARFMAPISESLNMVNGKWRRSSVINGIDTCGTALMAVSAVTGSVVVVSICIALWKGLFGCGRVLMALRGLRLSFIGLIVAPPLACISLTAWSVGIHGRLVWPILLSVMTLSLAQLVSLRFLK